MMEGAQALAPTGVIRIALNVGNPAAVRVGDDGALEGPAPELAKKLKTWANLPVSFLHFTSAGAVVSAELTEDAWDVAFLAVDPGRAERLHFTPPYMIIEATYAVRSDSLIDDISQIDRPGMRIASSSGAAYDAHLQRTLLAADRVPFANPKVALEEFLAGDFQALAGVRHALEIASKKEHGIRVLPGCFQTIKHALAIPRRRSSSAAEALDQFVLAAVPNSVAQTVKTMLGDQRQGRPETR